MPKKGDNFMETDAVLDKLKQAFSIDATIDEACFYAGINSDTYYRWKKTNPSKYVDIEALRNTPILAARQTLATAVKTDAQTALKYLERKRRSEFATRVEQEQSGEVVHKYEELNDEDLIARAKARADRTLGTA